MKVQEIPTKIQREHPKRTENDSITDLLVIVARTFISEKKVTQKINNQQIYFR